VAVAAALGSVAIALGSAPGAAASRPTGGLIHVVLQPAANGAGKILITGAIGDYGTTESVDRNGKPDDNGNYGKTFLTQGTFEVDLRPIAAKLNKVAVHFNSSTCSAAIGVTAPVKLLAGTGLYSGISGTVVLTESFGFIAPRFTSGPKRGKCNDSVRVQPAAQLGAVTGSGVVRFG
jgi:hypothetical protein